MASKKGKEILAALKFRYATKKFDPKRKVPDSDLEVLMESLRLSPSSMGVQPWKFLLVRDPEIKKRLSGACFGQSQLVDAPCLLVTCAHKELAPEYISCYMRSMSAANPEKSLPGKLAQKARLAGFRKMIEGYIFSMGQQRAAEWYKEQTYISLGFLLFACAHLGIDSCPIEGYDKAKAEKILGLGEMGLQLATIVAIGYRSKEDAHSKDKKVRFERKEVFTEI